MERYGAGDFLASALLFSAILAHEPLHADALRLRGLALVRAGLGVSVVPAAAASLRMAGVVLKPLNLRTSGPVELLMVWKRESDNPLTPKLVELAGTLAKSDAAED